MKDDRNPSTFHYTKTAKRKVKYVCKFCKVEVYNKSDTHAVIGREHKKGCPRRGKF